ncbi:amidohydrolase [Candidatus Acetothermia bacterium]|nr:amidohydrolase [Candidatus Acetothermia bacterium]
MKILIDNITALTLVDKSVLKNISISIENGRISKIAARIDPQGFDTVIEGNKKLVMPGFVNAHTHVPMVLLRGLGDDLPLQRWLEEEIWPAEAKLTDEAVYWGTLLGIAEMIRSGTTSFNDMYFHCDAIARAVSESGMRALLSYGMIAFAPGEKLEKECVETERFIKKWHGQAEGRIQTAVGPHAPFTGHDELWRRAIALAKRYNVPIHTHLQETRREVEDSLKNFGITPAARLEALGVFQIPTIVAHGVHLDDNDIEILARRNVSVIHCPTSNLKLGSGIAPMEKWLKAKLTVGIGTDGAASNNNLDMLEEMRLSALLHKRENPTALPAYEALRQATTGSAKALGWKDVGTISENQKADLIILDCDGPHWVPSREPVADVVYTASSADVETVIINGHLVMQNRKILTFDEALVKIKANEYSEKLRR